MKSIINLMLLLLIVSKACNYGFADDAVGVLRVDVGTNDIAEVEMPLAPLSCFGPSSYLSGLFLGNSSVRSDYLFRYDCDTHELTNAFWNGASWIDPATESDSSMMHVPGDLLYFARSDREPFDFNIFGRIPGFGTSEISPFFSSLAVNPTNNVATLQVSSPNGAYDIFVSESTNVESAISSAYTHQLRAPAASSAILSFESASAPGSFRLFYAADATLDSDGDGLSDALESCVYKTSPFNQDTDGDGIPDGVELAWGMNPLSSEIFGTFYLFEGFEKSTVSPGDINGQNGWQVDGEMTANVVEGSAYEGLGKLSFSSPYGSSASVSRNIDVEADNVWVDCRIQKMLVQNIDNVRDCTLAFGISPYGYIFATDGNSIRTNDTFSIDEREWTRVTMHLDYRSRRWDLYINGIIACADLKMRGTAPRFNKLAFVNGWGHADNLQISTIRPIGLSADGDAMADEWEMEKFGGLSRTGLDDFDNDGLRDAEEFISGSDPLAHDTDGDSLPDGWEVLHGLNPLDGNDASEDVDGDGQNNVKEFLAGGDPNFAEPDLLLVKPGLRAEFFHTPGDLLDIPDFSTLDTFAVSITETVDWTNNTWPDEVKNKADNFACKLTGFVRIPKTGDYTFYVSSDDGSCLSIDGRIITSDTGDHAYRETSGTLMLEAGWRPLELLYYENLSTAALSLSWSGPDIKKSIVPGDAFCHIPHDFGENAPRGFSSGVFASYFILDGALSNLPDFSGFQPDFTGMVSRIYFPRSLTAWTGAPDVAIDRFGAVFEGALLIRTEGMYEIFLASDDGARLYMDGKLIVDNNGNHSMTERSSSLPLSAGLHSIRIEYYDNEGSAGLELSWRRPDGFVETIPEFSFFHAEGIVDADSDGMPDWWEEKYTLDMLDPADAELDNDLDGLSNLEEFRNGSNPNIGDSDGDGMPDQWEAINGTCAFLADALGDLDGDGFINIEEYRYKTDPKLSDTDGDGCPDKTEVYNTRGNPLIADIVWNPVNVGEKFSGASFVSSTGTWRTDDSGTVFAAERAGSLTWRLTVPEGGADALALSVGQHDLYAKIFTFDLSLKVDGVFVTRERVSAQYGEKGEVYFFLPEIPPGEYEFTVTWHNWEVNTFLSVYDLRFVKFDGIDSDSDGIADWKEHRASTSSAMDALPCESLVSPLCIEGRDIWRDVLEINVDYPETNAVFAAVKTIGDGFYADIPLPLDGSAVVSMKDRSVSGSFPVAWKAFDVFAENYTTNALLVRAGDSLKIAPCEEGESEITISISDGENNWLVLTNWTESSSMPYCFETNGLYLVEVAYSGIFSSKAGYALVDAVSSRFPMRNPAILMDMPQKLSCPGLSPRNILEHDSHLELEAEVRSSGVELSLFTSADRDLGMVSRLSEDGAISDAVQVTPVWADNGTYFRIADNYSDGSQLVVVSLLLGAVTEGMTVDLEIFVAGVTFEDGTRFKTLTKDDFDENGHCIIRFIRARGVTTSVCHRTYLYQNGKLLYTNK